MKIKVRYFMTFSQVSGKRQEELEVPDGSTLKQLVELMKKGKSREFVKYLEDSLLNGTVAFLLNKSIADDDNIELKPDDEVIVSHVVGGG